MPQLDSLKDCTLWVIFKLNLAFLMHNVSLLPKKVEAEEK